jgi:recombinational DNA repair protein RecT
MLRGIATTNMNGNDFSRIAQKLMKGENLGFKTFEGESKIGYRSSDGLPHEEFHADPESKKTVLTDLFSLVPVESTREMDEALEEQEAEEAADVAEEELDADEWMKLIEDDSSQGENKTVQPPATETDLKK